MDKSELILNGDGSVYHLKLKPENLSSKIILVGDQFRVDKITKHFEKIEFKVQNREFKSVTGYYNSNRITVISTGIGSGNIDGTTLGAASAISIGSCSTQPVCGKCCESSTWAVPKGVAVESKTIARVEVVP